MDNANSSNQWPMHGLEAVLNCPVCSSPHRKVLYRDLTDKVFFCAPGKWTMYSCSACSSAYLDPRPTVEKIGLAYEKYFTHSEDVSRASSKLGAIKNFLEQSDQRYRYGNQRYFFDWLGAGVIWLYPNGRKNMDIAMRHLSRVEDGQRLLDFGCGNGEFLKRARDVGWDVLGVDLDPKAVEVARKSGIEVRIGGLEALDASKEKFDAITLSHVIEHVHQPLELLKGCYQLLKKGGYLWLETPNILSTGHRRFKENWLHLDAPRHLMLFNVGSLQKTLCEIGFSEIEVLPYRRLYEEGYNQSVAISSGADPFGECKQKINSTLVDSAERQAEADVTVREFVSLKAMKVK